MPLTEAQEGLWYAQALDPENPILNTGQFLDLRGPIDLSALQMALTRTIAETDALRLRFDSGPGGPRQWLTEDSTTTTVVDLSDQPSSKAKAMAQMHADSNHPLDLAKEPIAAFTIYILGRDRCLLYERIHHLAIDGYGMVLVTNRIGQHYSALVNGTPSPPPFPSLSRASDEDAAYRQSERYQTDKSWWHTQLASIPKAQGGPAKGRAVSGHDFIRESTNLSPELLTKITQYADQHKLGWPDILNALTAAYLARWCEGEITIGLPFMARMGRKIARLPCMAMNVLPQHIRPDEDMPLSQWLPMIIAQMQEARRHGLYRSEYLRRELGLVGGTRRLYGPLVNVQPFDRPPEFAGLSVGLHILSAGAVDDLTFTFRGDPASGILFEVDANPALYSVTDIAGHSARLSAFIEAALSATSLGEVPTASPAEIAAIHNRNDATAHSLPDTTLTELIEAQFAATPDAPALTFRDETLTYAELDRRSAALAAHLRQSGAGGDKIVAVALERSLELPIALLAILRAGAAYLPLDPEHPPERLARILDMAKPVAVLTSADLAGLFHDAPLILTSDWPQEGRATAQPAPNDLAYVIYTSGSTGTPKGVMIEHQAVVNRLLWMTAHYGVNATDRILQKTPASFDVSVWEFFLPLITGAELVMAAPGAHRDPAKLASTIRTHDITTMHFVPSMLSAFLASPASDGLRLRRVFCSGEELTPDQRKRFHERISAELHNLYGPTEAAIDVSYWNAGPDDHSDPIPIGWPVWNTRLEVLDDRLRPVPSGLAGHLYLGGAQLARGYLGRDDLTAERFVPDPAHPGKRLYATGDLAQLRHTGAVVYLGRSDHQVKIRGLRIELGEIEAAIMATGLARESVVLAREDHTGDKRLVAYLVPADNYRDNALTPLLAAILPEYMLPAAVVALPDMPTTSSGKLDRKALPSPVFTAKGREAQGKTELLIAQLFAEILHLKAPPSAEADFFALGGDSLSAVRLILRIEEETGIDPGLGTLFENPVLSQLAAKLDKGPARDDGLGPVILLADGDADAAPLFLIHPAGGLCWGYRHLARQIAPACPVWGLQHPGLDLRHPLPDDIKALAANYVARVISLAPKGPVHLAGWSVGGIIAHEMAVQLIAMGRELGTVTALDSYPADAWRDEPEPDPISALRALLAIAGYDPDAYTELNSRDKIMAFLRASDTALGALPDAALDGVVRVVTDTNRLVRGHYHRKLPHELIHFRAAKDHQDSNLSPAMWSPYAQLREYDVPFLHSEMTSAEAVAQIAPKLLALLEP